MRIAFIVSEFPKTTETFILRDLLKFREAGAEIRLYYLAPFRRHEIMHRFAEPLRPCVRHGAMLLGVRPWRAFAGALRRNRRQLQGVIAQLLTSFRREPILLLKSMVILPKTLAITEELREWRPHHLHAEFAGHPATAAWIINQLTSTPYSVCCRAHDLFVTQAFLDVKLRDAAFVRTISEFNRAFIAKHLPEIRETSVYIIHSSIDTNAVKPLPPAPRGKRFRILYVGALQRRKGVEVLLRAIATASNRPHWQLDIVGDGPERRRLSRLVRQLGLVPRVQFQGKLPFEAITPMYAAAHVVVAPSIIGPGGRTEGIPNVLIEALAHQRPVIATRVSGLRELVQEGDTGLLVDPGDALSLAAAIRSVEDRPDWAADMAAAGRALVEREFDLRDNARRQFEVFAAHQLAEGAAT